MPSTLPFAEQFETILRKHLRLVAADEPILPETGLVSAGLDSAGTINLLLDIEEEFAISIPERLLTQESFQTRSTLECVVAALLEGAS